MASFDPRVLKRPGTVLLDSSKPGSELDSSMLFADPVRHVSAASLDEVSKLLDALDAAAARGLWVAGYLTYEAGYAWTDTPLPSNFASPLGWFGIYEGPEHFAFPEMLDGWAAYNPEEEEQSQRADLQIQEAAYLEAVRSIKELIHAGDVYQINFTTHASFPVPQDAVSLYRRLRTQQPVPYGAFVHEPEIQLLSLSPELFFKREGRLLQTKPMKGTISRGRTAEEDVALQSRLANDSKSEAENLMIVDLLRNDLSRVCTPGSVEVADLFSVEAFESVNQMTSTVEGTLEDDISYRDIFQALFPCGSVTGAPKLRAMQRIAELEHEPRGAYCGAIGYISPNQNAAFNVAIRTAELRESKARMGTGSGIVWGSVPADEYRETSLKVQFLNCALRLDAPTEPHLLIETMRWENGSIPLLARHIERLSRSAQWSSYPFDEESVRAEISSVCERLETDDPRKVRLTLDAAGRVKVSVGNIKPWPDPLRVTFWSGRVSVSNPYLYHKTTRRPIYQKAYKEARSRGCDEALLVNEEGSVTEGSRTNVFIRRGEKWYTPPVSSGLLAGVYRAHLIEELRNVQEVELTPDEVRSADEVLCCNALRGGLPAQIIP